MSIRILSHAESIAATPVLSDILHATVLAGGSVNFCAPFSPEEARAYWTEDALPSIANGHRLLFAAHQFGMLKGTVSLDLAQQPNQPHRADVAKLLVHPNARRAGLAKALMEAVEAEAKARGRWLLTLDTWSGSPAEKLYRSLGYRAAGRIPDFFLHPSNGSLQPTTYFYKRLT